MNNKTIISLIGLVAVVGLGLSVYNKIYPPELHAPTFSENDHLATLGSNADQVADLIVLETPAVGQLVTSPLQVSGKARGYWFFEASFPYKVLDANGQVLGQGAVMTADEWMTEDFVNFSTQITFDKPTTSRGELVLMKDNPSGEPQYDNELIVPIKFE